MLTMTKTLKSTQDTLYFDGACPLCSAEIGKLKACASETLVLQDIHELPDQSEQSDSPSKKELLDRLHIRSESGEWITGIDANVRAWQHTRYARISRVLTWPVIRIFSSAAYEFWLFLRRRKQ